jgi:hypothetical protein
MIKSGNALEVCRRQRFRAHRSRGQRAHQCGNGLLGGVKIMPGSAQIADRGGEGQGPCRCKKASAIHELPLCVRKSGLLHARAF